jgi:hypothetical protein
VLPVANPWVLKQALFGAVWVPTFAVTIRATAIQAEYTVSSLPEITVFHMSSK